MLEPAPALFALEEPWLSISLSPWTRLAAFVWGLLWGSFTNVVIVRMGHNFRAWLTDRQPTFSDGSLRTVWRGRSRCPHCEHPIAGYDNIPVVSFLLLRGKCRHCGTPLAVRYLVVELLGGMLSFALFMQHVVLPVTRGGAPGVWAWALWLTFSLALLAVTYIDLDVFIVPDAIMLMLAVIGGVAALVDAELLGQPWPLAFATAAAGYGAFALVHLYYLKVRGIDGLGLGDVKLIAVLGLWLGPVGMAFALSAGALQGLLIAVPMRLRGMSVANSNLAELHGDDPSLGEDDPERVLGQRVPFGPFLALGAMEFVLLREPIERVLTTWLVPGGVGW